MDKHDKELANPDPEVQKPGLTIQKKQDDCRCKETAGMKPRELLRRMMNDLAFRKKEQKN